jgi:tetratricopeptide (TPR) repeat protein
MRARAEWRLILALAFSLVLTVAAPAWTAEEPEPIDLEALNVERTARAAQFPVSPRVSRYLSSAAKAADEGKHQDGVALLDKLNLRRLNPHERALVFRLRGYLFYGEGNLEATIENFEKVLAEEVMTVEVDNRIRFNIAQIYAGLQRWNDVISSLDRWFRYVETPSPLAYYLLGISYYQLQKVDLAISNTEKAIEVSDEPAEGWLQLLAALYIQKEEYKRALPLLEQLVIKFPKKAYWVQLSLIYGANDDYRHSLAAQQVAYLQGFITDDKELQRLARSYLFHGLPHPAAEVLEKAIAEGAVPEETKTYELLANSWIAAREYDRSLAPLEKAAELSEDGKLFVRLGQVYLQREEWDLAAKELQLGIEKGGLEKTGEAYLLLGIAHYNAGRAGPARNSFTKALQHESTRAEADRWIAHLANEDKPG